MQRQNWNEIDKLLSKQDPKLIEMDKQTGASDDEEEKKGT